jgi:hypothetical protein
MMMVTRDLVSLGGAEEIIECNRDCKREMRLPKTSRYPPNYRSPFVADDRALLSFLPIICFLSVIESLSRSSIVSTNLKTTKWVEIRETGRARSARRHNLDEEIEFTEPLIR